MATSRPRATGTSAIETVQWTDARVDAVLGNLRVIASIRDNSRVRTRGGDVELQPPTFPAFMEGVERWCFGEARGTNVDTLKGVFAAAWDVVDACMATEEALFADAAAGAAPRDVPRRTFEKMYANRKRLERFLEAIAAAAVGLLGLSKTYERDASTAVAVSVMRDSVLERLGCVHATIKRYGMPNIGDDPIAEDACDGGYGSAGDGE